MVVASRAPLSEEDQKEDRRPARTPPTTRIDLVVRDLARRPSSAARAPVSGAARVQLTTSGGCHSRTPTSARISSSNVPVRRLRRPEPEATESMTRRSPVRRTNALVPWSSTSDVARSTPCDIRYAGVTAGWIALTVRPVRSENHRVYPSSARRRPLTSHAAVNGHVEAGVIGCMSTSQNTRLCHVEDSTTTATAYPSPMPRPGAATWRRTRSASGSRRFARRTPGAPPGRARRSARGRTPPAPAPPASAPVRPGRRDGLWRGPPSRTRDRPPQGRSPNRPEQ